MSEAGKSAPPQHQAPILQVSIEEFRKIDLRIGLVVAAEDHPNADRLLVLKVDIGDGTPRQMVAGIKGSYQASELIGKRVTVK